MHLECIDLRRSLIDKRLQIVVGFKQISIDDNCTTFDNVFTVEVCFVNTNFNGFFANLSVKNGEESLVDFSILHWEVIETIFVSKRRNFRADDMVKEALCVNVLANVSIIDEFN